MSTVTIKTPEEIEKMRIASRLAARVLEMIGDYVKVGVTTNELNDQCHRFITEELDAIPASLNYKEFPKSVCTSVNEVVCHGIPNDKPLKDGDIVNIDVTVKKGGYIGDTSKMYVAGEPSIKAKKLIDVCYQAMWQGINLVKPGIQLGDIGAAIQQFAESHRCSVVREFCGHGIGKNMHESPEVLHYGKPGTGMTLEAGMTFTIEPMINLGKREIKFKSKHDKWTVVTKDRQLSAQWEHTILVTPEGYEVLTLRAEERQ